MKAPLPNTLARTLRDFFSDHLPRLRGMSPHTTLSYRDSLVLLLRFIASQAGRAAATLDLNDIGTKEVIAFLTHLERDRHNRTTTRNVRLAALHAFFRYVAGQHPDRLEQSQRILGIPFKRARSRRVEYLEYDEIHAVLGAVNRRTYDGRRDYALLATMFNTGARVQEVLDLRAHDLQLVRPYHARLVGKGRKERLCPLWPQTAQVLKDFCAERQLDLRADAAIFLNHRGKVLTRFGVRYILAKHLRRARTHSPTLVGKRLHPHSMRHSAAVHLLKAGVDLSTIAQWLGHASPNTTNRYATIDLEIKRQALARAKPLGGKQNTSGLWRRDTTILDWLEGL